MICRWNNKQRVYVNRIIPIWIGIQMTNKALKCDDEHETANYVPFWTFSESQFDMICSLLAYKLVFVLFLLSINTKSQNCFANTELFTSHENTQQQKMCVQLSDMEVWCRHTNTLAVHSKSFRPNVSEYKLDDFDSSVCRWGQLSHSAVLNIR